MADLDVPEVGGFDLHTHSNCSDGTLEPEEVVELARSRALAGIALTDHDTTQGVDRARTAGTPLGVEVITGCELSAEFDGGPVHVLGLAFDPDEGEFRGCRERIQRARVVRGEVMVQRLRDLGVDIDFGRVREIAGAGSVGRPHVAQALVEAGVVPDVASAFTKTWIGTGGRAYVRKQAVAPAEAVRLIRGAGGVAVLAHPALHRGGKPVPDEAVDEMVRAGLAGIEVDHPDQTPSQRAHWRARAAALGLEATASSDCHGALFGYRMGTCRTSAATLERLLMRRGTAA